MLPVQVQVVLNKERTGVEVTYNDAVLQIDGKGS